VVLFIPSNLAYGERGAGGVIHQTQPWFLKWKCSKKQVQNNKKAF
jgi:hypothetical protein